MGPLARWHSLALVLDAIVVITVVIKLWLQASYPSCSLQLLRARQCAKVAFAQLVISAMRVVTQIQRTTGRCRHGVG